MRVNFLYILSKKDLRKDSLRGPFHSHKIRKAPGFFPGLCKLDGRLRYAAFAVARDFVQTGGLIERVMYADGQAR